MEYVCKIYRNPQDLLFGSFAGPRSVRLPIFDRFPKRATKVDIEGDYLLFLKEDRHSTGYIFIYPPSEITEEQFEIINHKWDECIKKNLDKLEFEI